MVFADIGDPDAFGQALAFEMERTYGAHRIERMMLLADAETWIRHLADDWLPGARYQCDHWHLAVKVQEFCARDEGRFRVEPPVQAPGDAVVQTRGPPPAGYPIGGDLLEVTDQVSRPPFARSSLRCKSWTERNRGPIITKNPR